MSSTSSASDAITSLSWGSRPRDFNHSIYSSPAIYGSLLSTRCPVQSAVQSGAPSTNCVVPNVSGSIIRRAPSFDDGERHRLRYGGFLPKPGEGQVKGAFLD